MMSGESFTQAVHFKKLAKLLRRKGYTSIPETATISEEVKKTNEVNFVQWYLKASQCQSFATILSVHMAGATRREKREVTP